MSTMKITKDDIPILYSIPKSGSNLAGILRTFTYLMRAPYPPYALFIDCFNKSYQAGLLDVKDDSFRLKDEVHKLIHACEIDELDSHQLVGNEFPIVREPLIPFDEVEYGGAIKAAWNRKHVTG